MLEILYRIFTFFRPDAVARLWKGKHNVVVLLYHAPERTTFEQHVAYLAKHYNFIELRMLVSAIKNQDWQHVPKNAMVITFDDGHRSNYHLLECFKQYNIRPTIYLCTGIVATKRKYWWTVVTGGEHQELKRIPNKDRIAHLQKYYKHTNQKTYDEPEIALTATELKEMIPHVNFEAHTCFHPIMTTLTETELTEEINGQTEDLEKLGITPQHFAYPNGDYSETVVEALQSAGFESARTTDVGWCNTHTDLYRLKAIGITDTATIPKLKVQLSGIFGWGLHVIKGKSLKGKKKIIQI